MLEVRQRCRILTLGGKTRRGRNGESGRTTSKRMQEMEKATAHEVLEAKNSWCKEGTSEAIPQLRIFITLHHGIKCKPEFRCLIHGKEGWRQPPRCLGQFCGCHQDTKETVYSVIDAYRLCIAWDIAWTYSAEGWSSSTCWRTPPLWLCHSEQPKISKFKDLKI